MPFAHNRLLRQRAYSIHKLLGALLKIPYLLLAEAYQWLIVAAIAHVEKPIQCFTNFGIHHFGLDKMLIEQRNCPRVPRSRHFIARKQRRSCIETGVVEAVRR